jgi:hypothetical protein
VRNATEREGAVEDRAAVLVLRRCDSPELKSLQHLIIQELPMTASTLDFLAMAFNAVTTGA